MLFCRRHCLSAIRLCLLLSTAAFLLSISVFAQAQQPTPAPKSQNPFESVPTAPADTPKPQATKPQAPKPGSPFEAPKPADTPPAAKKLEVVAASIEVRATRLSPQDTLRS